MTRLELRRPPLVEEVIRLMSLNRTIVAVGLVYAGSLLFLRYAPLAPLPFVSPLSTTPDWVSWFDAYLTFPILIVLCLVPFRSSLQGSVSLACTVAVIPLYLLFASYFFFYAQAPLGLWALVIPLTLVVPTLVLVVILAVPLLNSLILARSLTRNDENEVELVFDQLGNKLYFLVIASISVSLALVQSYLRSTINGIALTGWVSDIGITIDAGARDLLNGINPYTHGLPPWGGPGGVYGPATYLLAVPFTFLPAGWAAHIGALSYAVLTSMGIWKCVHLFSPRVAVYTGALFLSLPTTSWAIEGGMASHLIVSTLIVWSLFLFFRARFVWSGLICGVGLLTLMIPGLLVVPYITTATNKAQRMRLILGFLIPIVLTLPGLLVLSAPGFLLSEAETAYANFGGGWLTPDLIFSPTFVKVISIVATGWLVFWLIYSSYKARNDVSRFLVVIATFLLILPFAAANYFAFFYVWGSAVALIAIFSLVARQQHLIGASPKPLEVSS
ncbi:MAG TPA: hypothetical protein VNA15_03615 [Candidatus Angelobacter sp.]|nr:hypothetical protein [Candidatus Angelobacter sp.]